MSVAAILFALHALPVCYRDQAWEGKEAQLAQIAQVIDDVSAPARDPDQRAAELVTIGYWESRFCRRVQLRARHSEGNGYWQLETYIGWVSGDEDQAVYMGAWNASRALERSGQCGNTPRDRFTAYAGRECNTDWHTVISRETTYYYIRGKINVYEVQREARGTRGDGSS